MEDRVKALIPEFEAYLASGMKGFDVPGLAMGIVAGDKPVGTMGSSSEGMGLGLVRIDRAADALAAGVGLTAGGIDIRVADPQDIRAAEKKTVA